MEVEQATERREHQRFSAPGATVQFRKSVGGPPQRFVCPLLNMSRGGAVFLSPVELAPGERMVLTLNTPKKSNYVKLVAHCCWRQPTEDGREFKVAVAFDKYGSSTEKQLAQLEVQYGFLGAGEEAERESAAEESGEAAAALPPRLEAPPEFAEVLNLFNAFEFSLETAQDILDVLSKGGDFDVLMREEEDDERSEMLRTLAPVHEMSESLPAAFDALGVPIGEPISYVFLPNTSATPVFGLQVNRKATLSSGPPRFAKRDVLLFSSEPARDFDYAFVVAGNQGWFGQVFFDREDEVRIRPPNEDYGERVLRREDVTAIWRMSAKVEHY